MKKTYLLCLLLIAAIPIIAFILSGCCERTSDSLNVVPFKEVNIDGACGGSLRVGVVDIGGINFAVIIYNGRIAMSQFDR